MFFHQSHNSIGDDVYNTFIYENINWTPHMHKGFELTYVIEGEAEAENNGKKYTLKQGEAMIVLPYSLHSYCSPKHSKTLVVVFSGNYVSAFSRLFSNSDAENCSTAIHKETAEYAIKILTENPVRNDEKQKWTFFAKPEQIRLKAALYALCSEFVLTVKLTERKKSDAPIFDILSYIEHNYLSDISLYTMAGALGYDFRYLSRLFSRVIGVNFKTLVNQYRCDKAKSMIYETDATISEIALASGFQSIRTFNRVFKELNGLNPSELRKKH